MVTVLLTDTFVSLLRLLKQKQIFLTTRRNRERKPERRDVCEETGWVSAGSVLKHGSKGLLEKHENLL